VRLFGDGGDSMEFTSSLRHRKRTSTSQLTMQINTSFDADVVSKKQPTMRIWGRERVDKWFFGWDFWDDYRRG